MNTENMTEIEKKEIQEGMKLFCETVEKHIQSGIPFSNDYGYNKEFVDKDGEKKVVVILLRVYSEKDNKEKST